MVCIVKNEQDSSLDAEEEVLSNNWIQKMFVRSFSMSISIGCPLCLSPSRSCFGFQTHI